eukprot:Clim_evm6s234 gene=Clim_evmTU6s234
MRTSAAMGSATVAPMFDLFEAETEHGTLTKGPGNSSGVSATQGEETLRRLYVQQQRRADPFYEDTVLRDRNGKRLRPGTKSWNRMATKKYLEDRFDEVEDEDLEIYVARPSVFAEILKQPGIDEWGKFLNTSEQSQFDLMKPNTRPGHAIKNAMLHDDNATAAMRWQTIDRRLRTGIRKANVPEGMLRSLEVDIIGLMSGAKQGYVDYEAESSFERLILHAVCQYHHFASSSKYECTVTFDALQHLY